MSKKTALFEHLLLQAGIQQKSERIDVFIPNNSSKFSRTGIKNLCTEGRLLVNNTPVKASYSVKAMDSISILMPYADYGQSPKAQDLNLEVLFEDEQIIVINKPAGMAVHPGLGEYQNTLLNGLLYHFENSSITNIAEPYFVQRLDKHTSGVMVIAKTLMANDFLQQQFSVHAIERSYVCQVWGNPLPEKGTLKSHIGRNPLNERLIQVSPDKSFGKSAVTHYQVLQRYSHSALVECRLETGRTHQIRIHMQHLGHSLVGDQRYPNKAVVVPTAINERANLLMPHQALHAQTLGFINPTDKQHIRFEVPPPMAFQQLQNYLASIVSAE